jgi:uncharacterized membrane protein
MPPVPRKRGFPAASARPIRPPVRRRRLHSPRRRMRAVSLETRALLALGYPLWPLAALALLDPTHSPVVRRQATQALALNFGLFGMWVALKGLSALPILGLSTIPLLTVIFPVWFVATVVFAVKAWSGDDVRVPLISDWLDEHEATAA